MSLTNDVSKQFSGADLKRIALVSMTLDHFGAIVLEPFLDTGFSFVLFNKTLYIISLLYWLCRLVGRIAFPLYGFSLVQGFIHTSNRWKYGLRLFIFALISQPFFSLALNDAWFSLKNLNIFFTLALALVTLAGFESFKNQSIVLRFGLVLASAALAELSGMDWGWLGISIIFGIYYFRLQPIYALLVVIVFGAMQITAPLSALFIERYNGQKGKVNKYFHYIYYPLHLGLFVWLSNYLKSL